MPSLGADMEAGTLVEWLKEPGETVKRGDIVAVVETQKGAIEIEVFEDGVLEAYLVEIDDKVPVGTPLATIRSKGEAIEAGQPKPKTKPVETTKVAISVPIVSAEEVQGTTLSPSPALELRRSDGERLRVTPAARRLAARSGVSLDLLSKGVDDVISLSDVEEHIGKDVPEEKFSMRDAIAAAMSRSKREIPHYYLSHTTDISAAENLVAETNKNRPPEKRLVLGALYLKAVAKTLSKYPEFNGHFTENAFHESSAVHAGMAINIRGGGLVAPAIHDTENRSLDDLMAAMRDLITRVRAGRFRARELSDATITITSLGDRGVEQLFGVIYPPQVAIVGIGMPVSRPWVFEGQVVVRKTATLTLAADHRVSDGHRGALFLRAIDKQLQSPEAL